MRVYLAGPDVFFADASARAARMKAECARLGLVGVFPLDPAPGPLPDAPEWQRIFAANEAHIRSCDAMVANITPFRGPSADVGTAWEMGFMRALGRPVAAWSEDPRDYAARVAPDGLLVEAFGLADNLMLQGGARVFRGPHAFAAALQSLSISSE
jgi:nucleoside 2-deoxyribosyltransferase